MKTRTFEVTIIVPEDKDPKDISITGMARILRVNNFDFGAEDCCVDVKEMTEYSNTCLDYNSKSNIIRTEDGWYVDQNGNKWNSNIYTIEAAERLSKTLEGCTNCINCSYCTDCIDCNDCSYCTDCTDCNDCISCNYCSKCSYCRLCKYCNCCRYCSHCSDCSDCHTCGNCSYCNNCSKCYDCSYRNEFETN